MKNSSGKILTTLQEQASNTQEIIGLVKDFREELPTAIQSLVPDINISFFPLKEICDKSLVNGHISVIMI